MERVGENPDLKTIAEGVRHTLEWANKVNPRSNCIVQGVDEVVQAIADGTRIPHFISALAYHNLRNSNAVLESTPLQPVPEPTSNPESKI